MTGGSAKSESEQLATGDVTLSLTVARARESLLST